MRKQDERAAAANAMLRSVYREERGRVLAITAGRILQGIVYMAFVFFTRALIDSAVAGDDAGILRAALWLLGVVLFRLGLSYGLKWLDGSTQHRALMRMRTRMYTDILHKKQRALSPYHSTVLLERLNRDLPDVIAYPVTIVPGYVGSLSGLVCAVWALFWMNRLLPALLLGAGLLLSGAGRLVQRRVKNNYRAYSAANEQAHAYYQESMANSLMLKVFRAQPQAAARAEAFERRAYGKWKGWFVFNQLLKSGVSAFFQLGYLGAMVFCATRLAAGAMSFGDMTAILQLVDEIQDPFSSLGDLLSARYAAQASAERLLELEELPAEPPPAPGDGWALYGAMAALEIADLTFGYDQRPVLRHASAQLEKGDFVVIAGRSGIGKSTLLKLLLGVYEDYSGRIELVRADGSRTPLDVSTRALFAYVPQQHMVFSGSVRDNLRFLCGQATDDELWRAARLADAEGFLRQLPQGLDTPLGERGLGLSEGQAQRLAIARALLAHAPILVLDEATSALDEETERRVLQNIRALGEITLLTISHRRAAFEICNREWRLTGSGIEGREIRHDG